MDLWALCVHSPGTKTYLCFTTKRLSQRNLCPNLPCLFQGKNYCAAIFHTDTAGKQTLKHWPVPCFITWRFKKINYELRETNQSWATAVNQKVIRMDQNIAGSTVPCKNTSIFLVTFFFLPCLPPDSDNSCFSSISKCFRLCFSSLDIIQKDRAL